MRAGRKRIVRKNANTAATVRPIKRNGSDNNQTIGQRIRASRAIGQHKRKRMHQATTATNVFMSRLLSGLTPEIKPNRDAVSA
jgi:hypothetical protein